MLRAARDREGGLTMDESMDTIFAESADAVFEFRRPSCTTLL